MDDEELLEKLEDLAEALGVQVRYEPAGGLSGGCVLRGQKIAIIDGRLSARLKVDALARILASEDHEQTYLPPEMRLLLDTYREARGTT